MRLYGMLLAVPMSLIFGSYGAMPVDVKDLVSAGVLGSNPIGVEDLFLKHDPSGGYTLYTAKPRQTNELIFHVDMNSRIDYSNAGPLLEPRVRACIDEAYVSAQTPGSPYSGWLTSDSVQFLGLVMSLQYLQYYAQRNPWRVYFDMLPPVERLRSMPLFWTEEECALAGLLFPHWVVGGETDLRDWCRPAGRARTAIFTIARRTLWEALPDLYGNVSDPLVAEWLERELSWSAAIVLSRSYSNAWRNGTMALIPLLDLANQNLEAIGFAALEDAAFGSGQRMGIRAHQPMQAGDEVVVLYSGRDGHHGCNEKILQGYGYVDTLARADCYTFGVYMPAVEPALGITGLSMLPLTQRAFLLQKGYISTIDGKLDSAVSVRRGAVLPGKLMEIARIASLSFEDLSSAGATAAVAGLSTVLNASAPISTVNEAKAMKMIHTILFDEYKRVNSREESVKSTLTLNGTVPSATWVEPGAEVIGHVPSYLWFIFRGGKRALEYAIVTYTQAFA